MTFRALVKTQFAQYALMPTQTSMDQNTQVFQEEEIIASKHTTIRYTVAGNEKKQELEKQ